MFEQRQQQEQIEQVREMSPAVAAAAASVLLSWYHFFLRGNRTMGLFVGLWPPTILAFASYARQTEIHHNLTAGSGLRSAIERAISEAT